MSHALLRGLLTLPLLCEVFLSPDLAPVTDAHAASASDWTTLDAGLTPRASLMATTAPDGKIYIFGGDNVSVRPSILDTAEVMDPRTGRISELPPMPRART